MSELILKENETLTIAKEVVEIVVHFTNAEIVSLWAEMNIGKDLAVNFFWKNEHIPRKQTTSVYKKH